MKKTALLLTIAVVIVITSYAVFAQEQLRGGGGMMDRGMMGQRPTPGMTYNNAIAATTDGGVVVLTGNTLIKYDNDLNVVKQTEIGTDSED